jgi:hypothetical protein
MTSTLEERLNILEKLGNALGRTDHDFETLCEKAFQKNKWFTPDNIKFAVLVWAESLTRENLLKWISLYPNLHYSPLSFGEGQGVRPVAVINAGNIPFAGMHDLLSVFITGNKYIGKNSSDDPYHMPYIVDLLININGSLKDYFQFVDKLPTASSNTKPFDTIIATGSNNSAHYFEYYFSDYPHIIRRNRNAVAVLTGNETKEELQQLGKDIFCYFGLGCRNVSKMYVRQGYGFNNFFEAIYSYSTLIQHNKYMNNFDYINTILLMNKIPFLQNGFLIVREERQIPSPIAVLHYEQYHDIETLSKKLDEVQEQIQCVVTNEEMIFKTALHDRVVRFGEAQHPSLWDYADGVDTVGFLLESRRDS